MIKKINYPIIILIFFGIYFLFGILESLTNSCNQRETSVFKTNPIFSSIHKVRCNY